MGYIHHGVRREKGGGRGRHEKKKRARDVHVRVGILRNGRMEDKDSHRALGPVDGGRDVCVGFFDQHGGGFVLFFIMYPLKE